MGAAAVVAQVPTIELRVADSCTRLDDAVAIAALFRCLVRALDRNREHQCRLRPASAAPSPQENKWHAQRYGIAATFVDPFARAPLVGASMARRRCANSSPTTSPPSAAPPRSRGSIVILAEGTSGDRQIDIFSKARKAAARKG